jgi:mycothiol synthase
MNKQLLTSEYQCRPVTVDDVETVVGLFNAQSRWLIGVEDFEVDNVLAEWKSPSINIATDTMAVFTAGQKAVGYIEFWGDSEPYVRLFGFAVVHPETLNQGIGSFLVEWLIERARRNIAKAPDGTRVVLQQMCNSKHEAAAALLLQCGYQNVRHSYHMRIDFSQPPSEPSVPEGIEIRSLANEGEVRAAVYAAYDSFRDHWGFVEQPFEEYYKRWKYYIDNRKDFDLNYYFIALDGDEIAGVSLCYQKSYEEPEMAWVGTLGVRRAWRKRGLGMALLQYSMKYSYEQGKRSMGLGVDASSLTGATRLYERGGMHVYRHYQTFELELRSGKDLSTQSVEE